MLVFQLPGTVWLQRQHIASHQMAADMAPEARLDLPRRLIDALAFCDVLPTTFFSNALVGDCRSWFLLGAAHTTPRPHVHRRSGVVVGVHVGSFPAATPSADETATTRCVVKPQPNLRTKKG